LHKRLIDYLAKASAEELCGEIAVGVAFSDRAQFEIRENGVQEAGGQEAA
jgi:hypothetical protein